MDVITELKAVCPDDFEALKEAFDSSDLPYIVNLVDFHNISDEFYQMIKNDLILAE